MVDRFGRTVDYLRLSVTGLCNYRCRYCIPEGGGRECGDGGILSAAECAEIVQAAAACGVTKVRLTGGEPLMRQDILDICQKIAAIPEIKELCLTTNGSLLPRMAVPLREAGVDRLNISLDTLKPDRFRAMTQTGELSQVLSGISAAEAAGFDRLKLNVVLIGGFNEDEIGDLLALTLDNPWELRFIELMPMGPCSRWGKGCFLSGGTVLERAPSLEPIDSQGVARRYRLPGAKGTVGLIAPLSRSFCTECRRIRVTADGRLKGCLHSREEIGLRGLHGQALEQAVRRGIRQKPREHRLSLGSSETPRSMNQIGG